MIHFRQAFHGRTGYTLSLTNTDPRKTDFFPKFPWPRIENPGLRFPVTPEVERDTDRRPSSARSTRSSRPSPRNPDDIAAILIEPIQAEGGDIHFRPEFLRALEQKAREHDVFFILDEVQTGVGITGKMWAHEHFGLRPDAVAFGKKMQVGGCMVGPRVDEEPENVFKVSSRINSTWGGGLTDMVRGARFLEIIHEDALLENTRVVGERLLAGLVALEREPGGKLQSARGLGLMIAFDLETPELRDRALERALANGLLLLALRRPLDPLPPTPQPHPRRGGHGPRPRAQEPEGALDDRARSDGQDQQRAAREPAGRGQGRERPAGPDLRRGLLRGDPDAPGRQLHDAAADRQHRDHRDTAGVRGRRRSRWSGREAAGGDSRWLARSRSRSRGSGRWARPWPGPCSRPRA